MIYSKTPLFLVEFKTIFLWVLISIQKANFYNSFLYTHTAPSFYALHLFSRYVMKWKPAFT